MKKRLRTKVIPRHTKEEKTAAIAFAVILIVVFLFIMYGVVMNGANY